MRQPIVNRLPLANQRGDQTGPKRQQRQCPDGRLSDGDAVFRRLVVRDDWVCVCVFIRNSRTREKGSFVHNATHAEGTYKTKTLGSQLGSLY